MKKKKKIFFFFFWWIKNLNFFSSTVVLAYPDQRSSFHGLKPIIVIFRHGYHSFTNFLPPKKKGNKVHFIAFFLSITSSNRKKLPYFYGKRTIFFFFLAIISSSEKTKDIYLKGHSSTPFHNILWSS